MNFAHSTVLHPKHTLIAMCVLLSLSQSSLAGPKNTLALAEKSDDKNTQTADSVSNEQLENLSGVSLEEHMRLRRDLNYYSRTSDPIHTQIEDRRRLMSKGIQERFFGADKDNDGKLSLQEVVDSLPQVARHYNKVDADSDNFISINELVAFQAQITERQRAAEIRIQEEREAELNTVANAAEDEVPSKQTKRPKIKSRQAETDRKPTL